MLPDDNNNYNNSNNYNILDNNNCELKSAIFTHFIFFLSFLDNSSVL